MKKIISILCSVAILVATVSMALPSYAETGNSIDTVIEELSELYQEETESGKELADSAECRIIVKATRKPDTYGNAQLVKGTDKIYIYQYSDTACANAALAYYNSLSYVQWAEADGVMESQSLSYGNDMLGSDEAKEYLTAGNISTEKVTIALLDVGINFRLKDFINSGRVIDSGVNLSTSGTEGTAQSDSGNYHGSNITSILLDNTTDNVDIIGYKVMDYKGQTTDSAVSAGIIKAVDDGADILNCSFSGEGTSSILEEAVNYAISNGVVVVAAAGNDCDDASKYCPANIEGVFTVGALDYNGNRAIFSNYGDEVDFIAPGYNVEVYGNKSTSSGDPDYETGTSFAAPYIASAAAMVLSLNKSLSVEEVKEKLIASCIGQSDLNYSSDYLSDVEISVSYLSGYTAYGNPDDEALFYGYGMPQMQVLAGLEDRCGSPVFSVSSGTFNDEFELTITAGENAEIYYTTDGSYPSNDSVKYTEPITISSTTSIRAIAYCDGKVKSVPSAQEYKIEYLANEADFEIDERGYITKYNGKGKNGNYIEIKVPDTINGITVRGVAENAFYDDTEEWEIEEQGSRDEHLRGIVLPDTVTEIEDSSFFNISTLKYFTAKGLKIIGEHALEAPIVYLDAPNVEYIAYGGLTYTELSKIDFQYLTYAEDSAFSQNTYLYEADLPVLETGGGYLFANCYRLRSVNLPSCTVLGDQSFNFCRSLKEVSLPELSTISYQTNPGQPALYAMFGNCASLNSIDLPSLETIEAGITYLFSYCTYLETFTAEKLTNICERMFNACASLENVIIPQAVSIDKEAFRDTYSLRNLSIPNVKNIDDDAFCNSAVSYIDAPELISIGSYVFSAYNNMYHYYLINGLSANEVMFIAPKLEEAADYAFAYTKMILSLDLPSLKTIGEDAFYKSSVNYLYAPELETAGSLPVAEDSVVVVSDKLTSCTYAPESAALTVQGVKGSYGEEYAAANSLEFIDMDAMGGSIRVTDAGLRFGYSFYDTQKKEVEEYGFVYAVGEQGRTDLTVEKVDGKSVLQLIAYNRLTHDDGTTTFNLVFTDIPQSSYDTEITARAYVKIDGKYYYSDVTTRSFNQVANAVLADGEIDRNTKNALAKLYEEVYV